jgi:hypothetical protein
MAIKVNREFSRRKVLKVERDVMKFKSFGDSTSSKVKSKPYG